MEMVRWWVWTDVRWQNIIPVYWRDKSLKQKMVLVSIVYKTELKGGYAKVAGFYKIVALHLQQTLENGSLHWTLGEQNSW